MNGQVRTFVDRLFEKYPSTQENAELRDELLADLSERFQDDLDAGLTEGQAMTRLKANLGDIRQLLDTHAEPDARPAEEPQQPSMHYPASEISRVSIKVRALDVVIEKVTGDQLLIGYEGNPSDFEMLRHEARAGVLTIREVKGDLLDTLGRMLHMKPGGKLHLGVPQSVSLDYDIGCFSGNVLCNVPVNSARVETFSGRVHFEAARHVAERLEISCKSGAVELALDARFLKAEVFSGNIDVQGWFGDAEVNTTSGGVTLKCEAAPESVDVRVVSGPMTLALPANLPGISVSAKAVSGKVRNAFEGLPNTCGPRVTVHTTSGSIKIEAI